MEQRGKVYLVGSGPGSLDYLTVKGLALLEQAEVLIYDALVDEALLHRVPDSCLKLDVGKRGGQPSASQTEINQYLVQYCQQGKRVVRLKGGDPFIFGRSMAEIEALRSAQCDVEVVPGLSSALVAPLLAGIPLTDPVLSRCFAICSAHEPDVLNWEALAQLETLVILMGTRHLADIVEQLLRWGRSPQTPVAIIRWAGQPQQQIWYGTLETIVQQTARQALSPAVITIGEVVRLHPYLISTCTPDNNSEICVHRPDDSRPVTNSIPSPPSSQRPLQGKTILVTRAAGQSSQFSTMLQQAGATVIETPALEIGPPSSWDELDHAIAQLHQFDWLILTSTNGVDYFFDRLAAYGLDTRALAGIKIAVVGQKTSASLQQHGLTPDFIPPDFVADSLVEHFPDRDRLADINILFPRVETGGRDVLVKEFKAQGASVTEVAAYRSQCPTAIAPQALDALLQKTVDVVTFASSKTVQCFYQMLEAVDRDAGVVSQAPSLSPVEPQLLSRTEQGASSQAASHYLDRVCIASIGPQTSIACQRWFGRVDVEAEAYTLEGLTQAILHWAKFPERRA